MWRKKNNQVLLMMKSWKTLLCYGPGDLIAAFDDFDSDDDGCLSQASNNELGSKTRTTSILG